MRKILILTFLFFLIVQNSWGEDFDSSVDTEIRKKYNVETLPPLPKVTPSKSEIPTNNTSAQSKKFQIQDVKKYNIIGKTYTIKSGTKVKLISREKVSNWNSAGTKISFISQNSITTKEGAVIPAGTIFKATVLNSHGPQITGNGGLIKLKVSEIYFNGLMSNIDTKLMEVNLKKIYNSNIKGERKYLKNCAKAMTPGKKTFKVMKKAAKKMAPIPLINILALVPYTIGTVVYVVNIPIAPIASVFMKGGYIQFPADTTFLIKTTGNNQIRG